MIAKKKRGSGGALLLKVRGVDHFKKLGQKSAAKRKEALLLWEKTHKKKSAKSARVQEK